MFLARVILGLLMLVGVTEGVGAEAIADEAHASRQSGTFEAGPASVGDAAQTDLGGAA